MAFVTWLLGHVCLALNRRSEKEPLFRLGLFSNRLMIYWAAATLSFVLIVTLIPDIRTALKLGVLNASDWASAIGAALIGTFWMEVRKLIFFRDASFNDAKAHSVKPQMTP
jgi:P-type Ca2+ transporter type 2C